MSTVQSQGILKRTVSLILLVVLLIEQPLWAASELIALKRAQAAHVEGKSLWLLGLEGAPDKEGAYHWHLGDDLSTLDKPLYIGTGKGQVTASIEPGEPGKGLVIRAAAPLCLDAIDKALSIPLVVMSEVSLTLGDVVLSGPFGGVAPSVRMSHPLNLTQEFALYGRESLSLKNIMAEGPITLSTPSLVNTHIIASDASVTIHGDVDNQGDIYGNYGVRLKGKTLLNKGKIRSRHGVWEEGHTICHSKNSLVFATILRLLPSMIMAG